LTQALVYLRNDLGHEVRISKCWVGYVCTPTVVSKGGDGKMFGYSEEKLVNSAENLFVLEGRKMMHY